MMLETKLTRNAFHAARQFIETSARPLEIARLCHAFDGGPASFVLDALQRYQNPDGGFGRALEPDLRAAESSALCTSIAFNVLRESQARPVESMLAAGMAYLLDTLNRQTGHWRIIPLSAGQSPHAPWWGQVGREDSFDEFSLNPTAEILGYLYDHQHLVPGEVIALVSERVLSHLAKRQEIEMHEMLCCLRLLKTKSLPPEVREPLFQALTRLIEGTVALDPAQWSGYCLRPLQVADDPDSPFMPMLAEAVAANLDFEIAEQQRDGAWEPTWTWGDAYPDDWPIARREWAGYLTLKKLLLLKRFGRIE